MPSEVPQCPLCQEPIPPDGADGLCPPCLARGLFSDDSDLLRPSHEGEPLGKEGAYTLLRLAGEGAFGLVYLAEQEAPLERIVALKILKPGLDSAAVLARFEAERRALASLSHEGIAQVYDAGCSSAGQSYIVMEWVDGLPVSDYCNTHHLDLPARLSLFAKICRAVEHAHQKGVIHRDIKPSNVLVTPNGQPKLIDFGLVRSLERPLIGQTFWTKIDAVMGTPGYMSPEQAAGGSAVTDIRADIYGLGALLYEMLTGHAPLDSAALQSASWEQLLQHIRETEPPRPSTRMSLEIRSMRKRTANELDWIVMRALEKSQDRRYQTVAEFREDVERFLNQEAVQARPPSLWYLVSKSVRKHRSATIAAVLIAITLIAATVFSSRSRQETRRIFSEADATRGIELLEMGRHGQGVATLCRALRTDPHNAAATLRLLNAMTEGPCAIPAAPLLTHDETIFHGEFLGDGGQVLTASQRDGVIKLWDWQPGSVRQTAEFRFPELTSVGVSQNLHLLADGTLSGDLALWRVSDPTPLWTKNRASTNGSMIRRCLFSRDGTRLYTAAHDGQLCAWDVETGAAIWQVQRPGLCQWVEQTGDGRHLCAVFQNKALIVCDASDGRVLHETLTPAPVWKIAITPEDEIVIGNGHHTALVYNLQAQIQSPTYKHSGAIYNARISPSAEFLSLEGVDGIARLWPRDGTPRHQTTFPGSIFSGAFSPDSTTLALGTREPAAQLSILSVPDLRALGAPLAFNRAVHDLAFHPGGDFLLAVSRTRSAEILDARHRRPPGWRTTLPTDAETILAFILNAAPTCAAITHSGQIWRWQAGSAPTLLHDLGSPVAQRRIWQLNGYHAVEKADASCLILTEDKKLHILVGENLQTITPPAEVLAMAISPDGSLVAATSADTAWCWLSADGTLLDQWTLPAETCVISIHGQQVACGLADGSIRIRQISAQSTSTLAPPQNNAVLKLVFSPKGDRLFAGDVSSHGALFDPATGQLLARLSHLDTAQPAGIRGIFSHDGAQLYTWGSDDLVIRVWDAKQGKALGRPIEQTYGSYDASLSPTGDVLASFTPEDKRVLLYNTHSRTHAAAAEKVSARVANLDFSADGRHLLSAQINGQLSLRTLPPAQPAALPDRFLTYAESCVRQQLGMDNAIVEKKFAELESARRSVLALPGTDATSLWMRWIASDPDTRPASPAFSH